MSKAWLPAAYGFAFAVTALVPGCVLSCFDTCAALRMASGLVAAAWLLRLCVTRCAPHARAGFFFERFCRPDYQLRVFGLPLATSVAIAGAGASGLLIALCAYCVLAHRYRLILRRHRSTPAVWIAASLGGFYAALEHLAMSGPELALGGHVLHAEQTPLQRIVVLEYDGALELFIDGDLQFCSRDEHLYHDGLLQPACERLASCARILIMGGGDGLAARDLLRDPRVSEITIVDWDRAVTRLFARNPALRALNADALRDPRVRIVHRDIRAVLAESTGSFDLVVGDLTDPEPNDSLAGALGSTEFYLAIRARLSVGGALVTHTSSRDGTWASSAVPRALSSAGFQTSTYRRAIPSFHEITYVVATPR